MPSKPSRRRSARRGAEAFFLDANIVMYAAGASHPLRDVCRAALDRAIRSRLKLVTDSEVLQEILYRYFSLGRPDAARQVYGATTRLCDEILPVGEEHTTRALELLIERPRLSPRDAVHIATMEQRGVRKILSTDRDFDTVSFVERIDPSELVP